MFGYLPGEPYVGSQSRCQHESNEVRAADMEGMPYRPADTGLWKAIMRTKEITDRDIANKGDGGLGRAGGGALLGRKSVLLGILTSGLVVANVAHSPAANAAGQIQSLAAQPAYVTKWTTATAYVVGQQVVNPNNDVVSANVAHTSSAVYTTDTAKWTLSPTFICNKANARVRSAVKLDGTDQSAALNAEITALAAYGGGTLELPGGAPGIKCNSTIVLHDGVTLEGAGLSPVSGGPTLFDFSSLATTSNAIQLNNVSDVALRDFYLEGWDSGGTASVISTIGTNRRVNIERVIINAATTGSGIDLSSTGWTITGAIRGCVALGCAVGFYIGSACTSIALSNCYADVNTGSGYVLCGTYLSLDACAADSNGLYGYQILGGKAIAFIGCGAEENGRSAFYCSGADGITFVSCRGHVNNTSGGRNMSLVAINDSSDNITLIGCVDSMANAASTNSVGNSNASTAGANVSVINCDLVKGVQPAQASASLTATTATATPAAGAAGALPAKPCGYAAVTINGVARKIAYY